MLQLLRLLTQLQPRFCPTPNAPFEAFAQWCIGQGLGPLVGYNLEYALPQLPAPRLTKDRLLSVFKGTLADNTGHLLGLKNALQPLQGRKLLLFDAFSLAEALYPHVGFRPLTEASLLVAKEDVEGFSGYLYARGYTEEIALPHAACGLSNGYSTLGLFHHLPGAPWAPLPLLLQQALPKAVFGPSVFSLGLEEGLLALCACQYAKAYAGPWIEWVDMREIFLSSTLEAQSLKAKAKQWGIAHALFASLAVLGRLFGVEVQAFQPAVPAPWEGLVSHWAEAFVALPEAMAQGRHAVAQEEERQAFEAMASKAPMELPTTERE
ncbi:MAG: nucleotidyltransferase family protein [Cystobacterineae bacterium]|nr:nucleotidyltransferase family protein [Cystobacterineae bacterium]